jgi:hypothetical protein
MAIATETQPQPQQHTVNYRFLGFSILPFILFQSFNLRFYYSIRLNNCILQSSIYRSWFHVKRIFPFLFCFFIYLQICLEFLQY